MRSDVRIGIAIGLVIILGVVVYFVLSNNGSSNTTPTAEKTDKNKVADGGPKKMRIVKPAAGTGLGAPTGDAYSKIDAGKTDTAKVDIAPVGGTDLAKLDAGKTDAAKVDTSKTDVAKVDVAPVGGLVAAAKTDLAKTDLAPIGAGKTELAKIDTSKTESDADRWRLGGPSSGQTPVAVVPSASKVPDAAEESARREYDTDGTPSMRGSSPMRTAPEPSKVMSGGTDSGVQVALVGASKGPTPVVPVGGADSNLGKLDSGYKAPDSGFKAPDSGLKSIDAATPPVPAASEWVAKGEYEVQADDKEGAWGIARKVYKNPKLHYLIQKANPGVDWSKLRIKQKLKILPAPAPAAPVAGVGVAPGTGNGLAAAPAVAPEAGKFSAPDASGARKYAVKKGDTGEGISKAAYGKGGHWTDIEKANTGVSATKLKVGQVLTIPALEKKAPTPGLPIDNPIPGPGPVVPGPAAPGTGVAAVGNPEPGKFSAADAAGARKYTVKKGDTGEGISKAAYGNGTHWTEIEKANTGVSATKLKVGQVLVIPAVEKKSGTGTTGASAGGSADAPAGTVGAATSGSAKSSKKKSKSGSSAAKSGGASAGKTGGSSAGKSGGSTDGGSDSGAGSTGGGKAGGATFD